MISYFCLIPNTQVVQEYPFSNCQMYGAILEICKKDNKKALTHLFLFQPEKSGQEHTTDYFKYKEPGLDKNIAKMCIIAKK